MKKLVFTALAAVFMLSSGFSALGNELSNPGDLDKCYVRSCTEFQGTDGFEYRRCSDWQEIDCAIYGEREVDEIRM